MLGDRYSVTTVASEMSAVKRSPSMNVDPVGDLPLTGQLARHLDQSRHELDAHTACPDFSGGGDDDSSVTRAEIVDNVLRSDARQSQHRVDDGLAGRHELDVRRARRWPIVGRCLLSGPRPLARYEHGAAEDRDDGKLGSRTQPVSHPIGLRSARSRRTRSVAGGQQC